MTEGIKHVSCDINNVQSILVDTPGYKDTIGRDNQHFNNLAQYLYGCGGVDIFLLIMNGTNPRFDGNTQEMLKYYKQFFGGKFWEHLVIIMTHIEGKTKRRFIKNNKAETMKENVRKQMNDIDRELELMIKEDSNSMHDNSQSFPRKRSFQDILRSTYNSSYFALSKQNEDEMDIPVITIGDDEDEDYVLFREDVMDGVVNIIGKRRGYKKFTCKHINSPIKRLEQERDDLEDKIGLLKQQMKRLQDEAEDLNTRIISLHHKINNPERYPLLHIWRSKE